MTSSVACRKKREGCSVRRTRRADTHARTAGSSRTAAIPAERSLVVALSALGVRAAP
jgi:hypothetical protein